MIFFYFKHDRYHSLITDKKMTISICFIWTLNLIRNIPHLIINDNLQQGDQCIKLDMLSTRQTNRATVLTILAMVIFTVLYTKIFLVQRRKSRTKSHLNKAISIVTPTLTLSEDVEETIRNNRNNNNSRNYSISHTSQTGAVPLLNHSSETGQSHQSPQRRKSLKPHVMMTVLTFPSIWLVFIACPFALTVIYTRDNMNSTLHQILLKLAMWIVTFTYYTNPVFYSWTHKDMRKKMRHLLKKLCCREMKEDHGITMEPMANRKMSTVSNFSNFMIRRGSVLRDFLFGHNNKRGSYQ